MSRSSRSFLGEIATQSLTRTQQQSQRSLPHDPAPLSFSDNDYLGLSRHPAVLDSAERALRDFGASARAARLLAGPCPEHLLLEESLASWKSTDRALLFSTGYVTPLGVIPALVGPKDTVILERHAHACLFDGAKLSSARLRLFHRQDTSELEKTLASATQLNPDGKILIVVESLHSMDGDWAPLAEIIRLKEQAGAWLLLDEAHASGICGPAGAGLAAQLGLANQIEIQMGTLGKALGSSGGFVAGSWHIIDHLLNEARTFLFGTALAHASVAAAHASLAIVLSQEGDELRQKLHRNINQFRSSFPTQSTGPIQPIPCGSNSSATEAAKLLRNSGVDVPAIRTPTVLEGTARLRVSLSSRHSAYEISKLTTALASLPKQTSQ